MVAATAYRISVTHVGVAPHERDDKGRLFFPRRESTRTACQARPTHEARMVIAFNGGTTKTARLCRHHAEEVKA